ncbi:MAG: hypothetical protein AAF449_12005 [Myxococcota bacterium]
MRLPRPGASHHGLAWLDVGPRSVERTAVLPPDSASNGKATAEAAVESESSAHFGVQFEVSPLSRLWTAVCFGTAGAFFMAALFRSFGALVGSFEHRALEALFLP